MANLFWADRPICLSATTSALDKAADISPLSGNTSYPKKDSATSPSIGIGHGGRLGPFGFIFARSRAITPNSQLKQR
jgi:hypothetical protein